MQLDEGLVKVEKPPYYGHYLLIIGILVLCFSLSFILRALPLEYGFELTEFDPFFNYRATAFMIENGFEVHFGITNIDWNNANFNPFIEEQEGLIDSKKNSFSFGFSYNFNVWYSIF